MPLMNSMGSLKLQRPSGATPIGTSSWLSVFDLCQPGDSMVDVKLASYPNDVYIFGSAYDSGDHSTPYYARLTESNGALADYHTFPTQLYDPLDLSPDSISGLVVDNNNNINCSLINTTKLMQYNTSGSLIQSIDWTNNAWSKPDNYITSSNGYLYILSTTTTYSYVTQINASTFSVVSCIQINITSVFKQSTILSDYSGNIYLVLSRDSTPNLLHYIKLSSTLSVIYHNTISASTTSELTTVVDSSGNLYTYLSDTGDIVIINSSGTSSTSIQGPLLGKSMSYYNGKLYLVSGGGASSVGIEYYIINVSTFAYQSYNIKTGYYTVSEDILSTAEYSYIAMAMESGSGQETLMVLKLQLSSSPVSSTPYNFTIPYVSGTPSSVTYSGTLNITSTGSGTLSSGTVSATSTSLTVSPVTLTSVANTPTYSSVTPFNYHELLL